MREFKIISGAWYDRATGAMKGPGDVVQFTNEQAVAFGLRNLSAVQKPVDPKPRKPRQVKE